MHVPAAWEATATRIAARAPERRLVLVVGAPDVGKSTFCAYLAAQLCQAGAPVGIVDCDIGQSSIGPPAAIGGGLMRRPVAALTEVAATAGAFVGAISPVGHLLPCAVGAHRVARRLAAQGAATIVVDTSGLVHGSAGMALKEHKFDLLQPSDTVIIQRQDELAHLAWRWQHTATRVHLLTPSPQVAPRSPADRRAYRAARFAAYFADASPIDLPLAQISLRNTSLQGGPALSPQRLRQLAAALKTPLVYGERHGEQLLLIAQDDTRRGDPPATYTLPGRGRVAVWPAPRFADVLCGLLDRTADLVALAILRRIDFARGLLQLLVPAGSAAHNATALCLGRLLLRQDGVELGVLRPGDL